MGRLKSPAADLHFDVVVLSADFLRCSGGRFGRPIIAVVLLASALVVLTRYVD